MKALSFLKQVPIKSVSSASTLELFNELYTNYNVYVRKTLYWMAAQDTIDDLVQEVFVKIWKNINKFREESQVKTWIYRITVNTAIDAIRKQKITVEISDVASQNSSTEKTLILQQLIRNGILKLPEVQRSTFVLYYKQDLSIDEIADILNINTGTVKSRLSRARDDFTEYLRKNGVNYE